MNDESRRELDGLRSMLASAEEQARALEKKLENGGKADAPEPTAEADPATDGESPSLQARAITTALAAIRTDLHQVDELSGRIARRLEQLERNWEQIQAGGSIATTAKAAPATRAKPAPVSAEPVERRMTVTAGPFADLTALRVVEQALLAIEGVDDVRLRELRQSKAVIEVRAASDVTLISGLRRTLDLAFDVIDSSPKSLEIVVAPPLDEVTDEDAGETGEIEAGLPVGTV